MPQVAPKELVGNQVDVKSMVVESGVMLLIARKELREVASIACSMVVDIDALCRAVAPELEVHLGYVQSMEDTEKQTKQITLFGDEKNW